MITKEFIKPAEAAEFLGIKLNYLYKLTSAHAIPFYSPRGRVLLFKVSELREYIERSRVATDEEMKSKADNILASLQ